MSHLDEGTLNALLDGELDDSETRQIQAHLGRCATCETRLDEVKHVRIEADQLIGSIETTSDFSAIVPPKVADAARRAALPPDGESWPILLPDPPESVVLRQGRLRKLAWAAMFLVVTGAGYLGLQSTRRPEFAPIVPTAAEQARYSRVPDTAVLGQEESNATGAPAPATAPNGAGGPLGGAESPARASAQAAEKARPTSPADSDRESTGKPATAETLKAEASAELSKLQDRSPSPSPSNRALDDASAQRLRDAAATADIDRAQRAELARRDQAEQARAEAQRQAPPPPPTIEQRAQVSLRIGLDEASRQLGGPMHVIEGMSPALVGLAPSRLSPGMDSTRPVVRAVYVDPTNRLILLDQQQLRPGQAATAAPPLRTIIDNVIVHLHGEPAASVLRNLARRIR